MKVPVCLMIDDPAPVISVYHEHAASPNTEDGRPLVPTYSNDLLFEFCDIVKKHGIKGKMSVVPMPGNKGDIVSGLEGVDPEEVAEWLDCVKTRLIPDFSICPEILTHNKAVDLATGEALPMDEREWSKTQDRTTMTPYISKALSLLKQVGMRPIGVTSPWDFGMEVESEYEHSISDAVKQEMDSNVAWYFLRGLRNVPNAKPWVAIDDGEKTLVSIPATLQDWIWQTINCTRTDDEYVKSIADRFISEDGTTGEIVRVLNSNGYPILVTHWQSLMSNGLGTGLKVIDEVARRVTLNLSDRVEWMSCEEILELVLADKAAYPEPATKQDLPVMIK